ncbi:MAG: nitroreductase [Rhodospirillales bacterium]|nr:nitroreductase [Alphaproteobacteria bacterium]MCB9981134.1 nitroreductase [Rhodospirillales bacterium]
MDVIAAKPSFEMLDYLLKRRSLKVGEFVEPGPNAEQLQTLLTAAARVPDHGKLCPFYFLVFKGDARAQAGDILAEIFRGDHPDARADKIEDERQRFLRSPLVVGIVMRARPSKHPLWEQMMSASAVAQNFVLAANALGFGVQWLSEWYAYDERTRAAFGLDERDVVAGFMHVGSPAAAAQERPRPDLEKIVTFWQRGCSPEKGDCYDLGKFEFPEDGFDFSKLKRLVKAAQGL